jgi:hypothetical protein
VIDFYLGKDGSEKRLLNKDKYNHFITVTLPKIRIAIARVNNNVFVSNRMFGRNNLPYLYDKIEDKTKNDIKKINL